MTGKHGHVFVSQPLRGELTERRRARPNHNARTTGCAPKGSCDPGIPNRALWMPSTAAGPRGINEQRLARSNKSRTAVPATNMQATARRHMSSSRAPATVGMAPYCGVSAAASFARNRHLNKSKWH
jgi:hypothetical protein